MTKENPYHFGYVITINNIDYIFDDIQDLHIALFLRKQNIDLFNEFLSLYATKVER